MLGLALVFVATQSPLEHYGNQLLWADFAGMLLLTMIGPPLILLGAPLTLAFPCQRTAGTRPPAPPLPGPRHAHRRHAHRVLAALRGRYLTSGSSRASPRRRRPTSSCETCQQLSLFAVSLLFWWPALCADPVAWRMSHPLRVLYIAVEMTHKGLFGGMFLSLNTPVHETFAANMPVWAISAMTEPAGWPSSCSG